MGRSRVHGEEPGKIRGDHGQACRHSTEEYEQYKDGTRFFSIEENLEAFSDGEGMKFMPFAAESMADFMVSVGFIPEKPDMTKLFDDSFIKKVAAS